MDYLSLTSSVGFVRIGAGLTTLCLIATALLAIYSLGTFEREAENPDQPLERAPWGLLFGTWRDSLTITLLYLADSFLMRAAEFSVWVQLGADGFWPLVTIISPVGATIIYALVAYIGIRRIHLIRLWQRSVAVK